MIGRIIVGISAVLASAQSFSFPCYLTLAKDSCWTNYDVTVIVTDANTNQQLVSLNIPKGQSWTRQPFSCEPKQKLMYQATFEPTIWEGQEGKKYMALRYWFMPEAIKADQSAWEIPVCFPADFSEVPLPADATANCQCNFKDIPAIPPKIEPSTAH